jgi:hypothetical protein
MISMLLFQALEKELCSLICEGTLHWRHKQMAIGMMLSIIVEDHIQPPEVVDMWLQVYFYRYIHHFDIYEKTWFIK